MYQICFWPRCRDVVLSLPWHLLYWFKIKQCAEFWFVGIWICVSFFFSECRLFKLVFFDLDVGWLKIVFSVVRYFLFFIYWGHSKRCLISNVMSPCPKAVCFQYHSGMSRARTCDQPPAHLPSKTIGLLITCWCFFFSREFVLTVYYRTCCRAYICVDDGWYFCHAFSAFIFYVSFIFEFEWGD